MTSSQFPLPLLLRIFIPFALGYFLSYLFRVVNAVIAPNLSAELHLDASDLGLLTAAYFLSFAAFQLPLGILLDRYGPRVTESILLLFAAAGAAVFALAETTSGLIIGRALIGFGVSACLMAAFKAFVDWFPADKLPMANGLQLAAGGLGALSATAPVEAALHWTDWRGVFLLLAVFTLVVAVTVFLSVPDRKQKHNHGNVTLLDHIQGVLRVFSNRLFWRITPWTVASQASFLSIQSLWAGPWLRDVAGFERDQTATYLALIATAMVAGFASIGFIAGRLGKLGIGTTTVAATGMTLFMLVQAGLSLEWIAMSLPLWLLFGFFGTSGVVSYAALSQNFPAQLAGRANTALNLLVFVAAFIAQWCIGTIIDLWPPPAEGHYAPEGFKWAIAMGLVAQVVAMAWFFLFKERDQ